MQVSPNQNYASSEKLDVHHDKYTNLTYLNTGGPKYLPSITKSLNNYEPNKCLPNIATKSANSENFHEVMTRSLAYVCEDVSNCWANTSSFASERASATNSEGKCLANVDANNCAECVKNHFWNKSILNKSVDNLGIEVFSLFFLAGIGRVQNEWRG